MMSRKKINKTASLTSLLLAAVRSGNPALVEELLLQGADPNACEDADGLAALYYAVSYSAPKKVFESLVRFGANLKKKNSESLTPLDLALNLKNLEIVKTLSYLSGKEDQKGCFFLKSGRLNLYKSAPCKV